MEAFFLYAVFTLALVAGVAVGWIGAVNFMAYLEHRRHDFEELFEKNPHPELYEENGKIYRGEYMNVTFEPGYDPDDFEPGDITLDNE